MSFFDGLKFRTIQSPIHVLDPRAKFLYVCAIFFSAILFDKLLPLTILFLISIPIVIFGQVKREWLRSMRGALFFAIIIFVTNLIFPSISTYIQFINGDIVFSQFLKIFYVSVNLAFAITFRFVVLVESFSIFFLTTSPDHLGLALEKIRIPHEFIFAFTTAVRFVPVLAEEAQTIIDAQKSRGLEVEKGNFIKKVRNYIPILIPLIVNAIRRSLELAEAMESRAWGSMKNRTNLFELKMKRNDFIMIGIALGIVVTAIYVRSIIPIPTLIELFGLA